MPEHRVRRELGGGASLERLRAVLDVPRPAGVRMLLDRLAQPVVLEEPLVTSEGVALGGHQKITLEQDGRFTFEGYFRATGWPSYRAALSSRVVGADGTVFTLAAHGEVHGSNEPGDRESSWHEEGPKPLISSAWPGLRHARIEHDLQYDVDLFGSAGDVLAFLAKAAVATAAGSAGLVMALGTEAVSALDLHELSLPGTVGVIVAGGVLLVGGSAALVPAVIAGVAAGVVVAELVHQRRLTDEEFGFVDRVFRGTLPRDRIVLTNLVGKDDRAFTIPGPGDAILVNLGKGFDDPIRYTGFGGDELGIRAAGQLIVHELTHAWQIGHATFLPGLLCSGIANQLGTLGGDMSVYQYGPPGPSWGSFNLEQQGSIVDEWFAGNAPFAYGTQQRMHTPMLEEDTNPYWRYIRDNIRTGVT